jgi:AcrR family transcriptional regulator
MAAPLTETQIHDVRAKLCEIAERQFATRGLQSTSLRSIATDMGWTAASLYRYFDNKDALLAATRAAAMERFSDRIEAAYGSTGDLWDRSRAISAAYAGFAMDEPNAYQLIFAFSQAREAVPPDLAAAEKRSLSLLIQYVRDMVDAGLLEGEPGVIARSYWVALHGLIALRMAGRIDETMFENVRHEVLRLITRGARPRDPGSTPG